MKILIIGSSLNLDEAKLKFGEAHGYACRESHDGVEWDQQDVVFDFAIDECPESIIHYQEVGTSAVFLNTTTHSLNGMVKSGKALIHRPLFGFCGLPTFLNREQLETSLYREGDVDLLRTTCEALHTKYQIVKDRVGLVTPRVISMIINEAYRTFEESIATRQDIDLAMKLGTNYPYGPFEWCERIGARNIVRVLEAVYNDSRDERYQVCELLKK